jgi:hypothetical protein
MQKIKLTSIYNTPAGSWHPGSIVELGDDEARRVIEGRGGFAVSDSAQVNSPTLPAENAPPAPTKRRRAAVRTETPRAE